MAKENAVKGFTSKAGAARRRRLTLLRKAVAAKLRYWDAVDALENNLCDGKDPTDTFANKITTTIEDLAAGLDTPADARVMVEMEHLAGLEQKIEVAED